MDGDRVPLSQAGEDADVDVDTDDAPAAAPAGGEPSELEQIAMEQGWSPQEQWRGPPEDWIDAREFIRRGPQILKKTLDRQDSELKGMRTSMERMLRIQEQALEQSQQSTMSQLEQARREAAEDGDMDEYDRLGAEIEKARETRQPAATQPAAQNGQDPSFQQFLDDNPWYGPDGDLEMTKWVHDVAAPVVAGAYQGAEFYDKIAEKARQNFPEKFSGKKPTPRRRTPTMEAGSGTGAGGQQQRGNNKGPTYADLPADAKQHCDRFVAKGMLTQEQYVKDYFSDEQTA